MTIEDRFWPKVDRGGPDECWGWLAHRNPKGYGRFSVTRTHHVQAHRFAYEQEVGPIPTGLTLDHLCRNRGCVNPAHLEPVTNRENVLRGETLPALNIRKTRCPNGHVLERDGNARVRCLPCDRANAKERYRANPDLQRARARRRYLDDPERERARSRDRYSRLAATRETP